MNIVEHIAVMAARIGSIRRHAELSPLASQHLAFAVAHLSEATIAELGGSARTPARLHGDVAGQRALDHRMFRTHDEMEGSF